MVRGFGPLQLTYTAFAVVVVGLCAEHVWLAPVLSHAITGR
jgi:hypothetical protein